MAGFVDRKKYAYIRLDRGCSQGTQNSLDVVSLTWVGQRKVIVDEKAQTCGQYMTEVSGDSRRSDKRSRG